MGGGSKNVVCPYMRDFQLEYAPVQILSQKNITFSVQFRSCLLFSFRKIALKGVARAHHRLIGIWYYSQVSKANSNIQSLNIVSKQSETFKKLFKNQLGLLQGF